MPAEMIGEDKDWIARNRSGPVSGVWGGLSMKLHPVAVILAVTIGAELAGIVGALLAVPVLTTVRGATRPLLTADSPPPRRPA
ncbi:hypothetical protein [Actinophytocola sp.]|uniref:hypothetical protein n=1 Tax=Actinophytocola sp. TaxID=1872138 RepID=UPI0025C0C149|nr:hypothetical protein [Actinophytocola sp.]